MRFRLVIVDFDLDLAYFQSTFGLAGSQVSDADFLPFGLAFRKAYLAEEELSTHDT